MFAQQRTIFFSGRQWTVKASRHGPVGPGPNYFSDSNQSVWVDGNGFLHMKIRKINNFWHSSEVILNESLGYGRYVLHTASRVDLIDQNAVLGIFTYDHNAPQVSHREIDIEISKWGHANNEIGQFIVQTNQKVENLHRFPIKLNGDYSSHVIDWTPERIYFQMIHGHHNYAPSYDYFIKQWTFLGHPVYKGNEQYIINLWQVNGQVPSNGQEIEVVVKSFDFIPA